ncbi:MAG: PE family protein [Mycobacterium sp.]
MSFVTIGPEFVEAAAHDLAGIGSSLRDATSAAAAPTTGMAAAGADEVSAAISALFGGYGQEFQALAADASAFHAQFVSMLNSGAGAYLSTEAAVGQTLGSAAAAPAQTLFGGAQGVQASAVDELNSFGATVAGPYQTLAATTAPNLQRLNSAVSANPAPLLRQVLANQGGLRQSIATGFQSSVQNLPAELANVPAGAQAGIQGLAAANPAAVLQGVINNQMGYGHIITTSLQNANSDLMTGFNALPASFQAANNAFAVGDYTGGLEMIGGGFLNPFFSGFNVTTLPDGLTISLTPLGAVGDVLPIFSIPGQMAQNFTNLLPAGSLAAHVSQNFTNLVNTMTNTSTTSTASFIADPGPVPDGIGAGIDLDTHMGLPLALTIGAIGGPVNGLSALNSSAAAFVTAVQTGDPLGATTAVLDAPANFANGFLNGQMTLPLNVEALGLPTTLDLPLDGILVGPAPYYGQASIGGGFYFNAIVTGTPLGGLVPDLLGLLPGDLAGAIGGTAPVFPVLPPLF